MARIRSGNSGSAAAIVVLGCGFVITLLVAIILYTKIETAKSGEQAAQDELAKYVKGADAGAANDFVSADKTVVRGMLDAIDAQRAEIAGLNRKVAELENANANMEAQFNTASNQVQQLEQQYATASTEFTSTMQDRQNRVNALITDKDNLQAQVGDLSTRVNTDIANASSSAETRIGQLSQQIAQLEQTVRDREDDVATLQNENDDLRGRLPKLPDVNTTLPDGRVASIFNRGRDLFINLGRNDGLVVGMTFEVFDPNPVIRLSEQGEARGKATIEVYSLAPGSATCRVVRLDPGEQIDPDDPVVNVAYDPGMDITVFAFGYFDIEGDGGPSDLDRINALVTKNGASIPQLQAGDDGVPILTPGLDYIILGEQPVLPEKPGPDEFDPEIIAAYQAKLAENEAYFRLVDDAKLLRIPVLNQNRFLNLIGYYVR